MSFSFKKNTRVYLDYNATSPPLPKSLLKAQEAFEYWGNPSSVHQDSSRVKTMIWEARQNIAQFVGCHPLEIIFTSGASESNNHALLGLGLTRDQGERKEIILSSVEHPSINEPAKFLSQRGFKIHFVPVSKEGRLDEDFFYNVLSEKTLLVSIMAANNETGTLFSLEKLIKETHEKGALFHSDMVQMLGKESINLKEMAIDLASFSGHKFYSLKGCGFLYCRKGLSLGNLIHGGPQERKRRAGTENTPGILSLGESARQGPWILEETQKLKDLRDEMEKQVLSSLSHVQVVSCNQNRLPNVSSFLISDIEGETLLMNLDLKGFSVSVGSACQSGKLDSSASLRSMGFTEKEAKSTMRVSLGLGTRKRDVKKFIKTLVQVVNRLRSFKN